MDKDKLFNNLRKKNFLKFKNEKQILIKFRD